MQQYLQHEHYALWEVIEFEDSYEVPANDPITTTTNTTSGEAGTKSGRTVTLTTKDMQKKKNDQYGNFRAEGSETLEQTFTRLQVIVEWLMHTIVWRNRSDLDTISLDDLYNHLKDWSYMANDREDHALVADEEAPIEFALMANTNTKSKVFDNSLCSKDCKKNNDSLNSLLTASKDLDKLIESQRSDKSKEGLGYTAVPPPPAQLYLSLKKDLSLTGLPECVDDTVTDYSRPSPTASDSQSKSKTDEKETPKKPPVKYAEQYRKPNKKPNVRGNQRNWNNLKSHQLGPNFVMKKKACFNCGDFNHLAYECRKRVKRGTT
nr:ubiquitin hydrolase [Tanacetum cinerariifolium]